MMHPDHEHLTTRHFDGECLGFGEFAADGSVAGWTLRPDQVNGVNLARPVWQGEQKCAFFTSPTGSGKSLLLLAVQADALLDNVNAWIVSPALEALRGLLKKIGRVNIDGLSDDSLATVASMELISTPQRLYSMLARGEIEVPEFILYDEGHHSTAPTFQLLDAVCSCPSIAVSATGYRGTQRGTRELFERWGPPIPLLTFADAVAKGICKMPRIAVRPLLDDDTITISNGEFVAKQVDKAMGSAMDGLMGVLREFTHEGTYTHPVMIALPSSELVRQAEGAAQRHNLPVVTITKDTKTADRPALFQACLDRKAALLQIKVVGEAVDLPISVLIDARPMMSPVEFVQLFGRITRPHADSPLYICTNRNIERHAYTLGGMVPPGTVAEAQKAFGQASNRAGSRFLGLEGMSKFKPQRIVLRGGAVASMYTLWRVNGDTNGFEEYTVVALPEAPEPLVAMRSGVKTGEGANVSYERGPYVRASLPADFTGFQTSPRRSGLTPAQKAWWEKSALFYGLDPDQKITDRQFSILPILKALGERLA